MNRVAMLCTLLAVFASLAFAQTGQANLERTGMNRHHDMSNLDQGAEACAGATVIPAGATVDYSDAGSMGATYDCTTGGIAANNDVFYKLTPTVTGNYLIAACNSDNSLALLIWTGTCCGTPPSTTYRDNANGCQGLDPRKTFALTQGTDYYIQLGYKLTGQSPTGYALQVLGPIAASYAAPGNDLCANATPLSIGASITGTNLGATDDVVPSCGTTSVLNGVWYSVVGDGHTLTASTVGIATSINSYLKVFRGPCTSLSCMGSNDNISSDSSASIVSWCGDIGVTYYIGVGSVGASGIGIEGNFALSVTAGDICSCDALTLCGTPAETEPNCSSPISCAVFDARQLVCGQTIYGRHCPEPDSDYYQVVVPAGQAMTIALYDGATCSTNPPTKVWSRMYTGACAASGAASAANKTVNRIAFATDTTVYVLVLDAGTTSPLNRTTYKLVATCQGVPANDLCANATTVAIPSVTNGTISFGTVDVIPTCYAVPSQPGVWYRFAGNGHSVSVDACVTSFDNKIAVFTGPDCANLKCHGGDDASCGGNGAKYTVCTTPGEMYWILVFGASVTTGTFTLNVTDLGVCAENDLCSGAMLVNIPSATNGTTVGYSGETPLAPTCIYNPTGPTVWYKLIGNGYTLTADLCANWVDYDSRIAVYSGDCSNLTCVAGNDNGVCANPAAASVTWCSEVGVEYFVLVYGFPGFTGSFTLTVTQGACCSIPRDYCADPIVVTPDVYTYANTANSCCATNPVSTLGGCSGYSDASGPNVIYRFDTNRPGIVSFWCSGPLDNQIMVFTDCLNPLSTCIAAVDDGGAGATDSIKNLSLPAGRYYVSTSASGASCGSLTLTIVGDVILPVEMQSAEAIPGDASVKLHWVTASENDNDHFEVIRDGDPVGSVRSQGNGPTGHSYWWTDENLANGTRYDYVLRGVSLDGAAHSLAIMSAAPTMDAATITEYALHQNYPNPFNPTTSIAVDLVETGFVSLKVYNLMGQEVASLINSNMTPGRHVMTFDASNLSSGIYLYRLSVNGFIAEKKMLLMK